MLDALGFAGCVFDDRVVATATRACVRGVFVARRVDLDGNVVGYVRREGRALPAPSLEWLCGTVNLQRRAGVWAQLLDRAEWLRPWSAARRVAG